MLACVDHVASCVIVLRPGRAATAYELRVGAWDARGKVRGALGKMPGLGGLRWLGGVSIDLLQLFNSHAAETVRLPANNESGLLSSTGGGASGEGDTWRLTYRCRLDELEPIAGERAISTGSGPQHTKESANLVGGETMTQEVVRELKQGLRKLRSASPLATSRSSSPQSKAPRGGSGSVLGANGRELMGQITLEIEFKAALGRRGGARGAEFEALLQI